MLALFTLSSGVDGSVRSGIVADFSGEGPRGVGQASFRQWALKPCTEGLMTVSETYTAVYERDGDTWCAEIAEEPGVRSQGSNAAEVRASIRNALAQQLDAEPGELHIVDDFRMPAQVRAAQESVKESRTEDQRAKMMASMTDSRSAMEWAEELGVSMRDPVTVEWLKTMGDKQVSIDTFCHTITMMEELSRLSDEERSDAPKNVLEGL